MQKISILGCGWLGKELATFFINKGHKVKGSTTSKEKLRTLANLNIEAYLIDIENLDDTSTFFDCNILIISITCKDVNAFNYLKNKIHKNTKVIYISSTSVYNNNPKPVTENSEINNGRIAQIESILDKERIFDLTILRFSGLMGLNRIPANFFLKKEYIPNPNGFVNMIHLYDCIGIINSVVINNAWNEIYNGASPHHPTRKDFYTFQRKINNLPEPIFKEVSTDFKIINGEKVTNHLGYTYKYSDLLKELK